MAVLHLHMVLAGHVMKAAYSREGTGASLNCSIYYIFLDELPRTPLRRSSVCLIAPTRRA